MSKFKVGDVVRIRTDLVEGKKYGRLTWLYGMGEFADSSRKITGDRGNNIYTLSDSPFWYSAEMLEPVESHKIVITANGNTTTAALYDGKKRIKEASAICSGDDEFDFVTGAKIAFERLTGELEEEERDLRELLTNGRFGTERTSGNFVVVGDKLVYESGGFDRISSLDASLKNPNRPKTFMVTQLYGDYVSCFDYIKRSKPIWERKENE